MDDSLALKPRQLREQRLQRSVPDDLARVHGRVQRGVDDGPRAYSPQHFAECAGVVEVCPFDRPRIIASQHLEPGRNAFRPQQGDHAVDRAAVPEFSARPDEAADDRRADKAARAGD